MKFTKGPGGGSGSIVAINATATATPDQIVAGLITSTSAAATTITTPTATVLATYLGANKGFAFEFAIDNTAGASVVTLGLGAGITANSAITGGTTLTVPIGGWGRFRIAFTSKTAAFVARLN